MKNLIFKIGFICFTVMCISWMRENTERAAAAGEVIEFNDISIPAVHLNQSRPPSYEGDNNWYWGTMDIDIPAFNVMSPTYNQVTGEFHVNLSNSYVPTSWIVQREALGSLPKSPSKTSRWAQGYHTSFGSKIKVFYADGTETTVAQVGTGSNIGNEYRETYFDSTFHTAAPYYSQKIFVGEYYYYDSAPIGTSFSVYLTPGIKPTKIQFLQSFSDIYWTRDQWSNSSTDASYPYTVNDERIFSLTTNKKPTITLTSQPNQTMMNDAGFSTYNVEGYVQDVDNDTVDVIAEIPNVFYKRISLSNTASPKNFSIPIDVLTEGIPPGSYMVNVKVVDPFNLKAEASISFSVTNRLRNKAFFLINSPIDISTSYTDYENDNKYADRYRYDQDPSLFDNSMGMISDSGLWRNTRYSSFPYTGAYVATHQARDNPYSDDRFDAYRLWSKDNLSSMTFMIHRKPIALFSAKLVNGKLQVTDSSYDLDHITSPTKGLITWQWQWRKVGKEVWTEGQPPTFLPSTDPYEIRLRVRDVDGTNGVGVWSDWMKKTVGSPTNLPPGALFTVNPTNVSYRKSTTIIDKSFDPDNDPLDIYYWTVIKDGWNKVWEYWGGATTPPNIAAFGEGNYQVNLQVHDNRGLWSEWYSQSVQVINHPPIASFTMPNEVYRDTVITLNNLTSDPDEDGDRLNYNWYTRLNTVAYNWTGSNRNQSFTVKDILTKFGISDINAISDGWEMRLNASDGSLTSYATQLFAVKNHIPTAAITGPDAVNQFDTKTYASSDTDDDSMDKSSLRYYWRVTGSNKKITLFQTPNINLTFDEIGTYTLEHWAVDQIGDKSNIATLKVKVTENLVPSMTLTTPTGTLDKPTIIDASKEGDPLIKWTYADPENDPQEKYLLEFYSKNGLLAKTVENTDRSGVIRQYQLPNPSLERFLLYSVQGRVFSKYNWSDYSNQKAFIIDNPPNPGFTLLTDTGKDATKIPIYRTDVLTIQSTATDADEAMGDNISYKYYLKPASGTEGLVSELKDFAKQFTSNGTFTFRQLVTDSLGLYRELTQSVTVVNRIPTVNITYPTSIDQTRPTIASTLTPIIKWEYQDEDGDLQQRYKVRIINLATGAIKVQSGEQVSSVKQWQIPPGTLIENEKYAVEVEVFDGFNWSNVSPRKYLMVNLLSIKGGVKHSEEWNNNRKGYNLKKSGNEESPRGYNVFWAGEKFILQGTATGLPDTVKVTIPGGYSTQLSPTNSDKTLWTGELYDSAFEKLPDGPITFTFTAVNEHNTKVDTVIVVIASDWSEYFQNHRVK